MRKNLKDQIIELYALKVDQESIIVQTKASPDYVRDVINAVKRKQHFDEIDRRNKAVADDFLSVPVSDSFSNFILCSNDQAIWEAYERMVNSKNTDKLW